MPTYHCLGSVVTALFLAGLICPQTDACAALARKPFAIASENAVIVWNEKTHTEHFIRTATFPSSADDIGFLVPTPSTPIITTTDKKVIDNLDAVVAPKVLKGDTYNTMPFPLIEVTDVGSPEPVGVAPGADLRTDLPRYRIYKDGVLADELKRRAHKFRPGENCFGTADGEFCADNYGEDQHGSGCDAIDSAPSKQRADGSAKCAGE